MESALRRVDGESEQQGSRTGEAGRQAEGRCRLVERAQQQEAARNAVLCASVKEVYGRQEAFA